MLFEWLQHITFAYPWVLLLITLLPLMGWWQHRNRRKHTAAVTVSTLAIRRRVTSWRQSLAGVVPYVRLAALTLLIVALARPQTRNDEQRAEGEGIDILLCLDVSGSMLA
ncbi:MAG TPA: BatA domain-containing protein, partial [Lacibacter sp.]|nr:BatA domain-containing protein [Lacibacter sp.]